MRMFLILTTLVAALTAHAASALTIATAVPKPGGASASLTAEVFYDGSVLDVGDPLSPINFAFVSALVTPDGTPDGDFDGLIYGSGTGDVTGDLIDAVLGEDRVDLLFGVTDNTTGEHWGDFVLATLLTSFDLSTGGLEQFPDPSALAGAEADVTLQAVQAIPLPASLPMLLGAAGALVLARRRQRG